MPTPVRLSLVVTHAPFSGERRVMVQDLSRRIKDKDLLVEFTILKDYDKAGPWPVSRKAWKMAGRKGATHQLVLQDDVIPCRDFVKTLLKLVELKPDVPIGIYANRKVVETARTAGSSWALIPDGAWGQAVLLPVALAWDFLRWERAHVTAHGEFVKKHYDTRVAMWLLKTKRPMWATVPSLIEHIAPSRSLLGFSHSRRVARWFAGADKSGLDFDWSQGLENPIKGPNGFPSSWWAAYHE